MGFDKYMGKERRKPYYRRGRDATSCRPHGGCPYCLNDRMYQQKKAKMYADMEVKEWGVTISSTDDYTALRESNGR